MITETRYLSEVVKTQANNDKLFIYDINYFGLLIEKEGNQILV